jgi:HD-GYP domain-containing protein (c-di-GMP phosphodiesterase class II)
MNAIQITPPRSETAPHEPQAVATADPNVSNALFELIHRHGRRVARLTFLLCREIGASEAWSSAIARAAVHHDIGKLCIPQRHLLNEDPLNEAEKHAVRRHAGLGEALIRRIMSPSSSLTELHANICRHHHERFDGSGYPDGLAGTHIPLPARIVAVTDVFDALTSPRPYRRTASQQQAMESIISGCNRRFDPELVEAFEAVVRRGIEDGSTGETVRVLEITEDRWLYRIAAAANMSTDPCAQQ